MARVAKIDNAFKKRFERQEKKRSLAVRNKLVYFLIVCEGEKTEPNYFVALEKKLPKGTVDLKIEGTGRNTKGLIDFTIELKNNSFRNFDRVWTVFDKDDFPDKNFNEAIRNAENNTIHCAWSNEAFELWFLLHFQFVNHAMKRSDYKKFLEREIRLKSKNTAYKYAKNDIQTFTTLEKYGNQKQAIEWARKLEQLYTDSKFSSHNPCTLVHKLIEELIDPKQIIEKIENIEE